MDRIADYEIVRSLGRGNHGEFFLARTPSRLPVAQEYVAVKVLTGSTSEMAFRWATRELSAFAAVPSPNLVALYDAGQQGDIFYYAMEYMPDGSLGDGVHDRPTVLRAMIDVAHAAEALHQAGMAHRDIKPENVMLYPGGAKLSDLGLTQLLSPGVTITGMGSVTSIEYTAPPLMLGEPASRATDVFSLGATLHRGLTGQGLYGDLPERDAMLALRKVLSHSPEVSPNLDPASADVVRWAISTEPPEPARTAAEFATRVAALA